MATSTIQRRLRVLIASPLEAHQVDRIAAADWERLEVMYAPDLLPVARYGADHEGTPRDLDEKQRARWWDLVASADVSFDFDWERPQALPESAPNLRWIQATSAGIGEYVRRLDLPKDSILLTTAAGIHAQPLAEFALLGALYFAKDVPMLRQWQAEHRWDRYCGRELAGSRALIAGMGSIGRRIAELLHGVGVEVIGQRRSSHAEIPAGVTRMITQDQLNAELPHVDYLIIAAPGTPETHHLFDERRLGLLPSSAVLINVGRGTIVEEAPLVRALQDGRLRGAALDVFEQEPLPTDSPLWTMPNVLMSPHSASTVEQENERIVDLFIENLRRYLDGQPLLNQFHYDRQY